MKQAYSILSSAALLGLTTTAAMADSISPNAFATTLNVGESVTINKVVTVDAGAPTSSKVDVFFLADTTGSMGSEIGAIQASAASILSSAAVLGDIAFGVGYYSGEVGDDSYGLYQAVTTNTTAAQAGINQWIAGVPSSGGDGPEANLYGLHEAASDPATGWRAGSERILVWFGDAPGHDPSPGGTTPSDGKVNEAQTIAALQAAGINVQAVDLGSMNSTGQASRIAAATGGDLYSGINTSTVVDTITDAISTSIAEYTTVGLDLSEVPTGVTVTSSPGAYVGDFDRSVTREFGFDVTFTADAVGDYDFNIYGTVDGGRVAAEADLISVRDGATVPDGGHALALFGVALLGIGAMRKKLGR